MKKKTVQSTCMIWGEIKIFVWIALSQAIVGECEMHMARPQFHLQRQQNKNKWLL